MISVPLENSRHLVAFSARAAGADRWRCLFENAEDAQVVCDRKGAIQEANHKAIQLLGLPRHWVPDNVPSLYEFLTPAVAQKLADSLKRNHGRQESLAGISLICDGRLSFLADIRILPLVDGCSLVTFKDASCRWRLESHMQRLMTAVDSTSDVIFLTDAEFHIAFVNAAFQSATGYAIEEALGRTADFLRAPASLPAILEYMTKLTEGSGWQGELINRRSDGTEYPVETTISPIYDKQGSAIGYAAFERDVSVRKQLANELLLERNHVLSIINSLDAAVYTLDHQFRLSHVNEGWKKLPAHHGWLDMSQPPEAGRCLLDHVKDDKKRAEIQSVLEAVLAEGRPQEIQAKEADGHYWAIKVAPWRHEGKPKGLIYVVTDQTRFHEMEHQLFQAQKMETIGALAAGVAHDFNNLLQAIRGNVSLLLLRETWSDSVLHQIQQIDQAAGRAAEITQQLLSFSRASDEKLVVLDFNRVIEEAGQLIRRGLRTRIELELRPANQPLRVKMDATRAHQMLLNLCVNAQDAMPQGGRLVLANVLVKLTARQAAQAQCPVGTEFVRCSVADTGTGIAPEILNRIFDPFFTTKEKGKGTGLGLAIVQNVTARANGFIEIESAVGKGTTFNIYLPRIHADEVAQPLKSPAQLGTGCGRIMVVDDLDLVLDFTRSFLDTMGFEVCVATNADEALKALHAMDKPVDLLLTDFNMPGMNGRELIQAAAHQWPDMKFILASGYFEASEREQITHNSRVRILDKPFSMREAAELVLSMLAPSAKGNRV